jgi:hypothetical protein
VQEPRDPHLAGTAAAQLSDTDALAAIGDKPIIKKAPPFASRASPNSPSGITSLSLIAKPRHNESGFAQNCDGKMCECRSPPGEDGNLRVDKLPCSLLESGALIATHAKYLTGLLGAPIAQSAAPAMHEAAGDAFGVRGGNAFDAVMASRYSAA